LGRIQKDRQVIDPHTVAQMAGTLGLGNTPLVNDSLPLPWYWLFATPLVHAARTGADGHPEKGDFLPPVALPRRMWAGSEVICHRQPSVGEMIERESRIEDISAKTGRSGQLVFVTVSHRYSDESGELMVQESQDLVYRQPATGSSNAETTAQTPYDSPVETQFEQTIHPDPVLLFRFSALTFNGHRIHYDRKYATKEEGYPGLVVHGPLIASLLLNLLYQESGAVQIQRFSFRAVAPVFDTAPFLLRGARQQQKVLLWALTADQQLAMSMEVELRAS